MNSEIKIFSPATVANVACGFDVLGFCLDTIGDYMTVRKVDDKGIRITNIKGFDLPFAPEKNVAGVAALSIYRQLAPNCGFDIEIDKRIKPGSGIGSSGASASGAVYAINKLLGEPLDKTQLIHHAMQGEALASKSLHADNLAPAIYGGFTLVKSINPLQILSLPTPKDLFATIIHPQIEIKTADSRAVLPKNIPLSDAIIQWANVGSLVHALHSSDYNLLQSSLNDVIIEPHRKQLIPHFDALKSNVLKTGALTCAISGSGPSVFALSKGENTAKLAQEAMQTTYANSGIDFETYVSKINVEGIKIVE
ncbi:homoserine kinase [Winogradskyella alexanderae]|uniref:Homoserine kinase n=1 Tax=Winogradskyella alexanderae TaxID=2877123 RepID=A0ABS7XT68_9FLAO|nr:homoserine kinase [Winogradskyella alexanderae]MCA0133218.1 homoserine kinase [Winogradskyella alexanderae]